jgi:hypothetical protein
MEKGSVAEIERTLHNSEVLDFSNQNDVFPPAEEIFGFNIKNIKQKKALQCRAYFF